MTRHEFAIQAALIAKRASTWAHDVLVMGSASAENKMTADSLKRFCDDVMTLVEDIEEAAYEEKLPEGDLPPEGDLMFKSPKEAVAALKKWCDECDVSYAEGASRMMDFLKNLEEGPVQGHKAQAYRVIRDSKLQPKAKAGTVVYHCAKPDYGVAGDDERFLGYACVSVSLDPDGDYPFFTMPMEDLEVIKK